jgi:hypothetical protein
MLTYRKDHKVFLGEEPSSSGLAERIRREVSGRTDKQVFLRGDGAVFAGTDGYHERAERSRHHRRRSCGRAEKEP